MKPIQQINAQPVTTPILQEMRVELLRNCPLLCVHCSAYAAPNHAMHLPLQRVLTLIDEFADAGGHRITFTGGEPLMYAGLDAALRQCCERGIGVRVFSSGIVLEKTERRAGCTLLQCFAPYLDTVMYSVYSAHPEAHDRVTRIPGSLLLTIEAIRYTVRLGVGTEIHFVPTQINYRDLPAVVELAATYAVPRVGILRFVPHGRGKTKETELTLDRDQHLWLRNTIKELRLRYPQTGLYVGSAYNMLDVGAALPCTAGINQLVVEANGNTIPCSAFSDIQVKDDYGNILSHPLQVVWQQSLYLQQVRRALASMHAGTGCLAQKTLAAGRIDALADDPLEGVLSEAR